MQPSPVLVFLDELVKVDCDVGMLGSRAVEAAARAHLSGHPPLRIQGVQRPGKQVRLSIRRFHTLSESTSFWKRI
jgi:predicted ester cyclase